MNTQELTLEKIQQLSRSVDDLIKEVQEITETLQS